MKPIEFKEQNRVLTKPESMTDEQCGELPVHAAEGVCTSCWKMTFKERLNAVLFGKIWVGVLTGTTTQPPISVQCRKTIFAEGK
jgi:hypothetical protein